MLIHFQYEAVSASWSRKKRPVFHRQTPPEYHKIAKKNTNAISTNTTVVREILMKENDK